MASSAGEQVGLDFSDGHLSPEELNRQLRLKKAAAQKLRAPVSNTSMSEENAALKVENAALKEEIVALKKEIAALKAHAPAPSAQEEEKKREPEAEAARVEAEASAKAEARVQAKAEAAEAEAKLLAADPCPSTRGATPRPKSPPTGPRSRLRAPVRPCTKLQRRALRLNCSGSPSPGSHTQSSTTTVVMETGHHC